VALCFSQPPIRCIPESYSPSIKRPRREVHHPILSSAEVKKGITTPSLPRTPSNLGAYLSTGTTSTLPLFRFQEDFRHVISSKASDVSARRFLWPHTIVRILRCATVLDRGAWYRNQNGDHFVTTPSKSLIRLT
jgi:hypothetical protein